MAVTQSLRERPRRFRRLAALRPGRPSVHVGLLGAACLIMLVVPPVTTAASSGPVHDRGYVEGYGGAVTASRPEAAAVAVRVLLNGGRAADAAVAGAAALGVVAPHSGGLGSGTALLHAAAVGGRVEQAQSCASGGALVAWRQALARWGTWTLPEAIAPAARLAADLHASGERIDPGLVATYAALAAPRRRERGTNAPQLTTTVLGSEIAEVAGGSPPPPWVGAATTTTYRGIVVAGGAAPALARLDGVPMSRRSVRSTNAVIWRTSATVAQDPAASVDVLVADRWGDVVAVTSSLGATGTAQRLVPGRGVWVGRPGTCARSLPTVLVSGGVPMATVSAGAAGGTGAAALRRVLTVVNGLVDRGQSLVDASARAGAADDFNAAPLALQVLADGRLRAVAGAAGSVTGGASVVSPRR